MASTGSRGRRGASVKSPSTTTPTAPVLKPGLWPPSTTSGDAAGPCPPRSARSGRRRSCRRCRSQPLDVLVVRLDRPQDRGHLGRRVRVAAHRVVDDGQLEVGGGRPGRSRGGRAPQAARPMDPRRAARAGGRALDGSRIPRASRPTTRCTCDGGHRRGTVELVGGRHPPATPARCGRRRARPSRPGSGASSLGEGHLEPRGPGPADAPAHEHRARRAVAGSVMPTASNARRAARDRAPVGGRRATRARPARPAQARGDRRSPSAIGRCGWRRRDRARCCVATSCGHRGLGDRCDHEHGPAHAAERRELDANTSKAAAGVAKHGWGSVRTARP